MKKFIEPEIKVTKFEYENLMNDTGLLSTPVVPDTGDGGDANPDDF